MAIAILCLSVKSKQNVGLSMHQAHNQVRDSLISRKKCLLQQENYKYKFSGGEYSKKYKLFKKSMPIISGIVN